MDFSESALFNDLHLYMYRAKSIKVIDSNMNC